MKKMAAGVFKANCLAVMDDVQVIFARNRQAHSSCTELIVGVVI